jgi:outer membrane protein assembly factor BamB
MQRIVASPVVLGDLLLAPSRVDPLTALDASAEGRPAVLWRVREGPDVPTPVMNDRHVFVLRDGGIMLCLDAATGATVWGPERLEGGTYSASPVLAGDRVYVTSESGTTTVLAATDRFEVLAVNRLDEYILSSLAVSDGQIFLRTSEHLYCLEDGETRSLSRAPRRPAQCARPPR